MARYPDAPIAISLGDPAGIGPEVIAKCWDGRASLDIPVFVAIGDARSVGAIWDGPIEIVSDLREADAAFDYGLPLIQVPAAQSDIRASPARIARWMHWSLRSGLRGQAPQLPSSPVRFPRSSSTQSGFSTPAKPSSSPNAAASGLGTSR